MGWSEDCLTKILVMIGDCPPHSKEEANSQMLNYKIPGAREIDWKEELDILVKRHEVKVYAVRCINRSELFYRDIADLSSGRLIDLDEFSIITDVLLAMCYKESSSENFLKFKEELQAKGKSRVATLI